MRISRSDAFPLTLSPPAAADVDPPDQLGERQRAHEPDPPTIADPTAPTPNGATPTPTNDDTPVFKNSLTAGARRCPP